MQAVIINVDSSNITKSSLASQAHDDVYKPPASVDSEPQEKEIMTWNEKRQSSKEYYDSEEDDEGSNNPADGSSEFNSGSGNSSSGNGNGKSSRSLKVNGKSSRSLKAAGNSSNGGSSGIYRNTETNNPSGLKDNNGSVHKNFTTYLPLYKAALDGNWGRAKNLLDDNMDWRTAKITAFSGTVLHVAAAAGHTDFVVELVKLLSSEELEIKNTLGETALHTAAIAGMTKAAKAMIKKNRNLTQIRSNSGWVPLLYAANYVSSSSSCEQKEMLVYLYEVTRADEPSPYSGLSGAKLICTVTAAGFYDIALSLATNFTDLATEKDGSGTCVLEMMAERPDAFLSGSQLSAWQRCLYSIIKVKVEVKFSYAMEEDVEDPLESSGGRSTKVFQRIGVLLREGIFKIVPGIKQVYIQKLMNEQALALIKCICKQILKKSDAEILEFFLNSVILKEATRSGIVELVTECISTYPDLIWLRMSKKTILEIAIEQRREKIFNRICGVNLHKKRLASTRDKSGNTILHLAAKLAPSPQLNSVSGAALQMQRELQWSKAVEYITLRKDKLARNNDQKTAQVVFTEEHKELVEKGEKWMRDTAQSCMLVATLIATVVFAAAFTVPGGNISDINSNNNGVPIYLNRTAFMVFAIADALALFFSTTSVLTFLTILTARYAEEDFLTSLPKKLIIGLATLFFSIGTMLIAFSAALSIVVGHKFAWVSVPIGLIACVPATWFACLQLQLFVEMTYSTYWPSLFLEK